MFKMVPEGVNIQSSTNSQMQMVCGANKRTIKYACMSHILSSLYELRPEST